MIPPSLLNLHRKAIQKLEDAAASALLNAYHGARDRLADKLQTLDEGGKGATFTAQHYAMMLVQVDDALSAATAEQVPALGALFGQAVELGARHVVAEIAAAERRFAGTNMAARLAGFLPVIPVEQVARLTDPHKLLLTKFAEEVKNGVTLPDGRNLPGIAQTLAESVTQGDGISKAAKALRAVMDEQDWKIERIARTEINAAANAAHETTIDQTTKAYPDLGLKKQWSAAACGKGGTKNGKSRTCEQCLRLNGTVVDADAMFEIDGESLLAPPLHPNCRCRCVPWCERWGKVAKMLMTLADLPDIIRKRRPSAQNAYRRAANRVSKDGPTTTAVHTDVPLGAGSTRKPRKPKTPDAARIIKSDAPRRYTLGVVYEPDVEDSQGDFATADEIEQACWDFNRQRIGTGRDVAKGALGIQHADWDDGNGEIIESYIAPCDMRIGSEHVTKGSWLMGNIWSPENWTKVQAGDLTGLSMGGRARRE